MAIEFSVSQIQRMKELGIETPLSPFTTEEARNNRFEEAVKEATRFNRNQLIKRCNERRRHSVKEMECKIVSNLITEGYAECYTPIIINSGALNRMGLSEEHALWKQVFWLNDKECLRPMLAPNLYCIMRHLIRCVKTPIRIFEVGPCFRKESRGTRHLEEFTMLNLVEIDPEGDREKKIPELVRLVMDPLSLEYELVKESSEVYGETTDVMVNGVEVASASFGPHRLDEGNGIDVPWAGVGFGIERLVQLYNDESNIKRVGRSLVYLDGVRLDI